MNWNGYSISEEAKQSIQDMLLNAYYKNGFFCMGDAEGERVMYQSTYEAASLLQWLVGEFKKQDGQERENGKLYYIDYECNAYMQEWDFEHWGI